MTKTASFGAKDVQALRKATGAGMMDAKRALERCEGDSEAAAQWLRESGTVKSVKLEGRDGNDGAVEARVAEHGDGWVAAIVEMRCETDFVARSDAFLELLDKLTDAVVVYGESATGDFDSDIADLRASLGEAVSVGVVSRIEAGAGSVLSSYVHRQSGRGVNAVIVSAEGCDESVVHDVALHIASAKPLYVSADDIPPEVLDAERSTLEALSRNEGKPEAAMGKIVEGRLRGFVRDNALMEQKFVKDEKRTVADIVGNGVVREFHQAAVGP